MVFGFGKRTSPNAGKTPSPNNKTLKNKANAARKAAIAQLNMYKARAVTKKGGKAKKIGGEISLVNFKTKGLDSYFVYAELCRDHLIPNVDISGSVCSSDIRTFDLLFKGANGFALKFICRNGTTYALKLIFNNQQMFGSPESFATFEKREIPNICKEFLSINRFNNEYIMKAYKYFVYDGNQFILSSQCGVARRDIVKIEGNSGKKLNTPDGKVKPVFSGLILENIQNGIEKILSNKILLTKNNIITLFLHYLRGLKSISDASYLHKDIKLNNLMFNVNPDNSITGKIIDFGLTYELRTVSDAEGFRNFSPSSTEYAPMQTDVPALRAIYNTKMATRSVTAEQTTTINEIRVKYDLYSLSKSFRNELLPKIKGLDFSDFLENVLIPGSAENFRERIDISRAIDLTLALLK